MCNILSPAGHVAMQTHRDGYDDGVAADLVAELGWVRFACAAAAALKLRLQGTNTAVSKRTLAVAFHFHIPLKNQCSLDGTDSSPHCSTWGSVESMVRCIRVARMPQTLIYVNVCMTARAKWMMTCVQLSVAAHAHPPHPDDAACTMLHLQSPKGCCLISQHAGPRHHAGTNVSCMTTALQCSRWPRHASSGC